MGVNTLNLEVVPLDEVSLSISKSAGFVIGSPTLGGHMPTQVKLPGHQSYPMLLTYGSYKAAFL